MHYYLVDFENVGVSGLNGLQLPGEDSEIRIFLSVSAHLGTAEIREDILASKARIETFFCNSGHKNAMDFEIAAYAGAALERKDTTRISIISVDHGYAVLEDYARRIRKEVTLYRARNIIEAYVAAQEDLVHVDYAHKNRENVEFKIIMEDLKKKRHGERMVQYRLRDLSDEEIKRATVLFETKRPGKEMYLQTLHEFGRVKGTEIYRQLKKLRMEIPVRGDKNDGTDN